MAAEAATGRAADGEAGRLAIVVLGAGRVGRLIIRAVRLPGCCIAVDNDPRRLDDAERLGATTLFGDAANPAILRRAELDRTRVLVIAIGDHLTAHLATERALALTPA